MAKKFDTNPLDPNFPEKAKASFDTAQAGDYTAPQNSPFRTAEFPTAPHSITEEETRRFEQADFDAYSYKGAQQPATYQPASFANVDTVGTRNVGKTGIPEKFLIGLPYIPFSIGLVAGLILLLVIPKEESKVRFHAAQGLAAHVGILLVTTILKGLTRVTDLAEIGLFAFYIVTTIMLFIFAWKAWKGKPVHIESVDDMTNWLEDKIGPVKSA